MTQDMSQDITTGPGFVARSRKAFVAAIASGAAMAAPMILQATGDGVFTVEELWPILTVTIGSAAVGFLGVWYTPNAE